MREAKNGKIFVTKKKKKSIRAIALGNDCASEHEQGMRFRSDYVGDIRLNGQEGRQWVRTPADFRWLDLGANGCDYSGFMHVSASTYMEGLLRRLRTVLHDEDYFAWDQYGFIVMTRDKKMKRLLRNLYEAAREDPSELCFIKAEYVDPEAEGFCIGRTKFFSSEFGAMKLADDHKDSVENV